jgi:GntR family transcriptional regulator
LDLRIDPSSAVPIYAQVIEQIKALIAGRALRPGDALPSIRELAVALRINRNTAAKAYQQLEAEGILETRPGRGSAVSAGATPWSREERLRRLERSVDRALVDAHHLEIPLEEVPAIVAGRIAAFREQHTPAGRTRRKG